MSGSVERYRVGRTVGRTIYRHVGDDPDGELIGVMDTREFAARVVSGLNGSDVAELVLWIGYGDDWVLEPSRVVVDGPGVWASVVSGWVRDSGMGAVRVRVTPEGGVPIERFCSVSGRLWRTRYEQSTGTWLLREMVGGGLVGEGWWSSMGG